MFRMYYFKYGGWVVCLTPSNLGPAHVLMLQRVAVCCSVLQRVAACRSVLQCADWCVSPDQTNFILQRALYSPKKALYSLKRALSSLKKELHSLKRAQIPWKGDCFVCRRFQISLSPPSLLFMRTCLFISIGKQTFTIIVQVISHKRLRHVALVNETCRTYEWDILHICMRNATCRWDYMAFICEWMNGLCHTYEWVIPLIFTHINRSMNGSCHKYEWVMSHIWMGHVICHMILWCVCRGLVVRMQH